MTEGIPSCLNCKWFKEYWKCKAFKIIPSDIAKGLVDHTKPYPGDKGIQFEKKALDNT